MAQGLGRRGIRCGDWRTVGILLVVTVLSVGITGCFGGFCLPHDPLADLQLFVVNFAAGLVDYVEQRGRGSALGGTWAVSFGGLCGTLIPPQ